MHSKGIDITNCQPCKSLLLEVEYLISVGYCYQTAETRALYECTDESAGQSADNMRNPEGL